MKYRPEKFFRPVTLEDPVFEKNSPSSLGGESNKRAIKSANAGNTIPNKKLKPATQE